MNETSTPGMVEPLIEWSVASAKLEGQTESGDLFVVKPFDEGVLVGVIDGLGHGDEAAAAAKVAGAALEAHPGEPVIALIKRCHEELRGMRGAVIGLASINARYGTMNWIGIGNVAGALVRVERGLPNDRENLLMRGGIVGHRLPFLKASVEQIAKGDTLLLATDGILESFVRETNCDRPPDEIAGEILGRFAKKTDDALVLVARYRGEAA